MYNKIIVFIMFVFGFTSMSFSKDHSAPSYIEIFSQQQKCNPSYFNNSSWDKKLPLLARMKTNTYVVISKPTITELPTKPNQVIMRKDFKVSAIIYSKFRCETNFKIRPSLEMEGISNTLVAVFETGKGTAKFHIAGGDPSDISDSNPDSYSDFLYEANTGDNRDGLFCVVLIDDFLKDSNTINIDNLCPGKLAKNKEVTKKGIEATRRSWLAVGLVKTK